MVLVPIRKQFKELTFKNILAKPQNILTIQNYMESRDTDDPESVIAPIGIRDTIKDKLGISSIDFFLDEKGKIYIQENNQKENHLIEFSSMDDVGKYIDYITKLGILCKLYDKKLLLSRENERGESREIFIASNNYNEFSKEGSNFEKFMLQNEEKMQKSQTILFNDNEFSLLHGQKKMSPPTLEKLEKAILEKFAQMDAKDIYNSQLSQYEYRKIIGIQYQDMDLSQEDIRALSLYKHGLFDYINGFLRGDLSFLNERKLSEERFVRNDISRVIECIGIISKIQKRFISTKDMTLTRMDARVNKDMGEQLEYDNFVSTSGNAKLFKYAQDGIKPGGLLFIKVPKGTPIIPMDIVTEKQMSLESSVSEWGGGDVGYEESEMLIPMCDIEVNNHQTQNGLTIANATMIRQKNLMEIMERRLEEISDMIVQYGGKEKLEELRRKVQTIKSQNIKKIFTAEEIGKATINTQTKDKKEASKIEDDILEKQGKTNEKEGESIDDN